MVIANDATTKGGSFFKETIRKHVRAQDIAFESRLPVVYLVDCGGANLAQWRRGLPRPGPFRRRLLTGSAGCRRRASRRSARGGVGECTGRRRLHPRFVGRSRHDGGQQQRPSRRAADRQGRRHPRDRRSRHAGRRGDAQHRLRRLRSFRARRDGGDRQDPRHRGRAQPRAARPWRHPTGAAASVRIPPRSPASSAPI